MENNYKFFNWHLKCLFIFLVFCDATFSEKIVASTLAELQNSGWHITGSNPAIFEKPGLWSFHLEPLDSGVTASETWQVTSTSQPTKFLFPMPTNVCNFRNVKVHVRYFSENSVLFVQPCELESENHGCYGDPGNYTEVVWQEATFALNAIEIQNGAEIEISTNIVPSEGYIFFDQITIEHNGEACENTTTTTTSTEVTTQEPTTTEFEPTTSTFNPSTFETTTLESTSVTDISTIQPPECSTTPTPEPCDCCDRCSSKVIQEIHNHYHGDGDHHHHYYYPVVDASQNEK